MLPNSNGGGGVRYPGKHRKQLTTKIPLGLRSLITLYSQTKPYMRVCLGPSLTWAQQMIALFLSSAWASIQSPHHDGGQKCQEEDDDASEAKQATKALIINGSLFLLGLCQCPSVLPRLPPRAPNPKNRYCPVPTLFHLVDSSPNADPPTRFVAPNSMAQSIPLFHHMLVPSFGFGGKWGSK